MKMIPSQVPERSIRSKIDVLLTWLLFSKATHCTARIHTAILKFAAWIKKVLESFRPTSQTLNCSQQYAATTF